MVTARVGDGDRLGFSGLGELSRHADVSRITVIGMVGDDLAELVADVIGSPVPAAVVDSVAAATEGNPFFAEEMTTHLVDSGLIVRSDDGIALGVDVRTVGVPERVRETVLHRLGSLSTSAMELLSIGSLVGREFELSVAAGRVRR